MKIMNASQFEEFLNAITYEWISHKDNANKFRFAGINPEHWPAWRCRSAMLSFMAVEHRGFAFASSMVANEYSVFDWSHAELPEELDVIKEQYNFNLRYYRAKALAKEIQTNPENADHLISDFLNMRSHDLQLFKINEEFESAVMEQKKLVQSGENIIVLPNFPKLSWAMNGFNPGRITIITARSGFGKTKLATTLARAAAAVAPVLYFNMEMSRKDFTSFLIQGELGITNEDWNSARGIESRASDERIAKLKRDFETRHPILFTEGRSIDVDRICSAIYGVFSGKKLGYVFIDYDQKLVFNSRDEEWRAITKAVEKFDDVSKDTNTHIILLSQGNDDGNPKSAMRSIQPASNVIHFTKTDDLGQYYLKFLKARHARNGTCLEVDFRPEQSQVHEMNLIPDPNPPTQLRKQAPR